jgi:transposase
MANNNSKNNVTVLGIDLAKQSFQLHGVDSNGITILKKKLTRKNLCQFIALMPACIIGIEACGDANYWLRVFEKFGHTVHMIAPQFVSKRLTNHTLAY